MGIEDLDPYDAANYNSDGSFLGVEKSPEGAGQLHSSVFIRVHPFSSKAAEGNVTNRRGGRSKDPPASRTRRTTTTPASTAAREPSRPSQRERNVPDVSRPDSIPSAGPSGPNGRDVKEELEHDENHTFDYTHDEIQIIPAVETQEPEEDNNNRDDTEDEVQIIGEVKEEVDAGETDRYDYSDDEIQILSSTLPPLNKTINIDEEMPTERNTPSPGVVDPRGALRIDRRPNITLLTQKSNSTPEISSHESGEVGSGDGGGTTKGSQNTNKGSQSTTKSGHSGDVFDESSEGMRRVHERDLSASGDTSQVGALHEVGGLDDSGNQEMPDHGIKSSESGDSDEDDDEDDRPPPPPPHRPPPPRPPTQRPRFVVHSSDSDEDSPPPARPPPPKRPLFALPTPPLRASIQPRRYLNTMSAPTLTPGRDGRGSTKRKMNPPATGISRTLSVSREIDRLQRTTNLQIPRLAFQRVVKDITEEVTCGLTGMSTPPRWQSLAMTALQEASEVYITHLMEDSNSAAQHAGRVTVMPKDVQLVQRLRKK